jgi:uncharacterized metal-binding protein YceD (DUF177 family)
VKALPVEFSRPLVVDRIPKSGSREVIAAEGAELEALARRMKLPAVHALRAELWARPWRGGLELEGAAEADIDQVSVISLETFRQSMRFAIQRYFLPHGSLSPDAEDEADAIENGMIDMGEVVAETLALELEPYPRKPGEIFSGQTEPEGPAEKASPFAALARHRGS